MNNKQSQTLHGQYAVVKLPDGQEVLMSKLENGKWVSSEDRLKEDVDFDTRFNDTKTIPNDFVETGTDTLTPDPSKMKANYESSRNRMEAYLIEMLGNPDDILNDVIKVREIKEVRIREHIQGLIKVLNSPKWTKVREKVWK